MKKKLIFMMAIIMFLCSFSVPGPSGGIFPTEVSAKASASTKKRAAKAYRDVMAGSDDRWFCVMDIDKDGLKELLVTRDYNPIATPAVNTLDIYKYRKGVVHYIFRADYTNFGYLYNKKTKRIHGLWGNRGSMQDWYLTAGKSGKLRKVYLSSIEERVVNGRPVCSYSYAGKKISKKAYWKKKKEWNKNYINLKMYKASRRNIKKYIK